MKNDKKCSKTIITEKELFVNAGEFLKKLLTENDNSATGEYTANRLLNVEKKK